MVKEIKRPRKFFSDEEYANRIREVRNRMSQKGIDACLISSPENVYYLTGLDHQGYFAFQLLVVTPEGAPVFISRAMEQATVRDQIPNVRHVGYSDGIAPLPSPEDQEEDLIFATRDEAGNVKGLRPWEMSAGVSVRGPLAEASQAPVVKTLDALRELGLENGRIGVEKSSSFLPMQVAEGIVSGLPNASWFNISGLVDDCRMVQSPRELECTRRAAEVSDAMMLSAIATAGPGVPERDVIAAVYAAMFRRGGTYPGFIPLIRTTRTIEHEHGTWQEGRMRKTDTLFLEMAGCVRRYHAPLGRLVFIGKAPNRADYMQNVCEEAMFRAAETIRPGITAGEVYRAWQDRVDRAGLKGYRRHHCGYSVGIGFPPSWSGSGTPQGLRNDSVLEIKPGMVFHLMSWLLRTGRGDSFLSDTIVVTDTGCEFLTKVNRGVTIR